MPISILAPILTGILAPILLCCGLLMFLAGSVRAAIRHIQTEEHLTQWLSAWGAVVVAVIAAWPVVWFCLGAKE